MRLRNRYGTPVDPVPFVVVAGLAFMLLLSFGPLYGQALGARLDVSIGTSLVLSGLAAVVAYYQQVWTARPDLPPVAAGLRAERLFHLMLVLAAVFVGLAIPLVVR